MAKRERRKAEKRWRRTKLYTYLAAFKVKRNANRSTFIEEKSKDQKKLFAASNRLVIAY